MAKCDVCGKGPMFGNNRSHALNATRRQFKPNLTKRHLYMNGQEERVRICNRCLRTLEKRGQLNVVAKP